jgi:hypothetical protein
MVSLTFDSTDQNIDNALLILICANAGIALFVLSFCCLVCTFGLCKLVPCCNKKVKSSHTKSTGVGTITLPNIIKQSSFEAFNQQLLTLKKCKTITINIDRCTGGSSHDADRLCLDILYYKKKYKCRFVANVKRYAYSAGAHIALCCDEIVADEHVYFSPCDTQIYSGRIGYHIPGSDIKDIISAKGDKVNEEFIHLNRAAERDAESVKDIFNRLIGNSIITEANKEVIYTEFFSGKNSHSKMFSVADLKRFGIAITIKNDDNDDDVVDVAVDIDVEEKPNEKATEVANTEKKEGGKQLDIAIATLSPLATSLKLGQ